jgi:IS30 family transposase
MKRKYDSTGRTGVKHFTWGERNAMQTLTRAKWPFKKTPCWAQLGRDMGRSRRSVKAEYLRGKVTLLGKGLEPYGAYSAEKGQQEAEARHANKGAPMRMTDAMAREMRSHVVDHRRSPSVALAKMRKAGGYEWLPCARTVYRAIENGLLEVVRESLPYGGKRRKMTRRGTRMAYSRMPGKSIGDRPKEAEGRKQYGHWEMDTVCGPMGGHGACLLVLTERSTREEIIALMPDRTQRSVHRALRALARSDRNPFGAMRSLTSDNGGEFWDFRAIEAIARKAGAAEFSGLFYAHPSCPHERGSNENANRLIRRHLPKGTDFSTVKRKRLQEIEDEMNNMERASLGWKSALEMKKEMLNATAA